MLKYWYSIVMVLVVVLIWVCVANRLGKMNFEQIGAIVILSIMGLIGAFINVIIIRQPKIFYGNQEPVDSDKDYNDLINSQYDL